MFFFQHNQSNKISLKLFIYILAFSSIVTLFTSAINLYAEYAKEMKIIAGRIQDIQKSYLENLSHSLWYLDTKSTEAQLNGIMRLPDIQYLEITLTKQKSGFSAGSPFEGNALSYDFPLIYRSDKQDFDLGSLHILINLENVYQRLINRLLFILGTKAIEIFLISAFIFYIVQRLITRHLVGISDYVKQLNYNHSSPPLKLEKSSKGKNELNYVVDAINEMNSDLFQKIEALRNSEEKSRTIIESSADAIFITDRNGGYVYVNKTASDLLGYTEDELTELNIRDISLEERVEIEKQRFQKVLNGEILFAETSLRRKDGSAVPVDMNVVLLPNGLILGSCRDITKRKLAEKELGRLQNYLSNIINSMPSVIIGIDVDGKITQWNKRAEISTGVPAGDALGKQLSHVLPQRERDMANIMESIRTKQIKTDFNRPKQSEEGQKYESYTIFPLITNGVEGAVIRIDDVTKEYNIVRKLNQSQKMDAIGQLAGGIAHDFNNMLTGIMSAAQLLRSPKQNLNEKGLTYVDMILTSSNRAAELTAKLLQFGREESLAFSDIDLHKIIDDVLAIFKSTLDKKISLEVINESDDTILKGDASAIQNAIMNLGINASHAMPDGGTIQIKTKNIWLEKNYCDASVFDITPGKYMEIEIRDSGTGIPLEHIKKIFDPFFTTKEQGKGTGLGLSSVYGTIQIHHGAITVYSEEGTGTVFHIYLPCSKKTATPSVSDNELIPGTGKILLVDDEAIIRTTGQSMLEDLGYETTLASNGREALEIYKKEDSPFDLVILDMIMPEMNGTEAFNGMKEYNKDCKVIIASGFTKDENIDELKKLGLAGFIRKPFRMSELSKLISEVLET